MVYDFKCYIWLTGSCSGSTTWHIRKVKDQEIISGIGGGLPLDSYFDSDETVLANSSYINCRAYFKNTMFPTSEGWTTTNPPFNCVQPIINTVTIPSSLKIRKEKNCYYTQFASHVKISCGSLNRGLRKYLTGSRPAKTAIYPNDHNFRTPIYQPKNKR